MHLGSISKFPPPCAMSKKTCAGKKKAPRSKNIKPNVSAYNNGVPPHPMEPRSTKQVHGSKKQKPNNLGLETKIPGSSTNTCRSKKKISPQGAENTHARPTHFSCPQVGNKYGRVHKTCPGPENILPNKQ